MLVGYVLNAAIICTDCAEKIEYPFFDNDQYKKIKSPDDLIPYFDSEESDSPISCDICFSFIKSSLTIEGQKYVIEKCAEKKYSDNSEILKEWEDYFHYLPISEERNRIKCRKIMHNYLVPIIPFIWDEISEGIFIEKKQDKFYKYTTIGFYPLYYIDTENEVLCSDCSTKQLISGDSWYPIAAEINYEDSDLYCSDCSEKIESCDDEN